MADDELPKDDLEQFRTRASSGDGGGRRRRKRVGSTNNDDESLFKEIMRVLRKIERQTGRVPTVSMLAGETGLSLTRIREVISKFLPDVTIEGDTEFESSLKSLLFDFTAAALTPEDWRKIQKEHKRTGESISRILLRMGLTGEKQLKTALELQYGVNYLSLAKIEPPSPECLELLPEDLVRDHKLVPVMKTGKNVMIAMVNPNNLVALNEIKTELKDVRIKLSVCTEEEFDAFIQTTYPKPLETSSDPEAQDD